MVTSRHDNSEHAEVIALKALGFLASDPERMERFMALSGLTVEAIRRDAAKPAFLGGLLDHILADQTLLMMFAESEGIAPGSIESLRRRLPGAPRDF